MLRNRDTGDWRYKLVPMEKPRLPVEALEFFREAGRRGGKLGGKRRVKTTTPEQRRAWAKKAAAASVKVRSRMAKAKAKKAKAQKKGA